MSMRKDEQPAEEKGVWCWIRISTTTRQALWKAGDKGDTYDKVITQLLKRPEVKQDE